MAVCAGYKRDGSKCTATVGPPQSYCWWHDPANAGARRRATSKGGRARPSSALAGIKTQLQEMADGVLSGETNRATAAVAGQLLNIKLRAIEIERKIREAEEFEERLEALEQRNGGGKGGKTWRRA